jgi:hypothetical protein
VHLSGLEIGTRRSPTARQQDFVQFARSEQNRDLTTAEEHVTFPLPRELRDVSVAGS